MGWEFLSSDFSNVLSQNQPHVLISIGAGALKRSNRGIHADVAKVHIGDSLRRNLDVASLHGSGSLGRGCPPLGLLLLLLLRCYCCYCCCLQVPLSPPRGQILAHR